MELKTTLERVAFLLETIKITRINYSALIVLYWKVFDNIIQLVQSNLFL